MSSTSSPVGKQCSKTGFDWRSFKKNRCLTAVWLLVIHACSKLLPNVPRLTLHTNHSLPHPYLRQGHRNVRFHLRSKKYLYPELWVCHFLHMALIYWLFTICILFQRLTQALPWSLEGDLVVWCYCLQQCDPMDSKLRMGQFLWQGTRTVGGRPSMCIILMRRPDLDTTMWSAFVLFVLFVDLKMTQCPLEVKCATHLEDRLF